jgi:hypothetical protein
MSNSPSAAVGTWAAPGSPPNTRAKALYQATLQVEGPTRFEGNLPFPALARTAPRDQAGHPRYYSEAALLAIPNRERLPAHEFVFELPSDAGLPMDHVILYNVPDGFGARDFSVGVSTTDAADSSFTQMLRASLEPHANPQRFDFAPVPARYVRLRVHGGHGPEDGPVRLAEFEAYDTGGRNVAGGHAADRTREGARLVRTPGDLGTHLTPRLVWWPMAKPFIDYLSRCSFLLQQGLFVADVCYYYGDQGYNFVPPKHVDPSLGYGFDYDVTNAEVILQRMTVRDGRVTLPDGMRYELLVLPERDDIDPTVLRKVAELVEAGATVVGPKPTKATGLHQHVARDQAVRALAGKVWALAPIKANAGCCPGSIAAPPAPGRSGLHPGRGRAARPNPPGVQR